MKKCLIRNIRLTLHIAVMYKQSLIAGFTLISILLAATTSTRAELASDINSLTIKRIERSTTGRENNNVTNFNSGERQIATNSQQSMRYVQQGWMQQKRGNNRQALFNYYQAAKLDRTNAYAFLAAGNLLGETKEGVTCMRAAVTLFQNQGNQEGYNLAVSWLEERGFND